MRLSSPKQFKKAKRVGRGYASGKGSHTTGRGNKGQKSRSGYKKPRPGFEGGQSPLAKRLPKLLAAQGGKTRTRGFKTSKIKSVTLQLSRVADSLKNFKEEVTMAALIEQGVVKDKTDKKVLIKVVFDKNIDNKLNFKGIPFSKTAKEAVEKAGGKVA